MYNANIGYRITIVEIGKIIGQIILIGEDFVIAGSKADPLVHNREREPLGYNAAEVLIYPLEINSIMYIHDGRANVNIAESYGWGGTAELYSRLEKTHLGGTAIIRRTSFGRRWRHPLSFLAKWTAKVDP